MNQRVELPNGYMITVKQTGPTMVSRTSAAISLLDPSGESIEMCGGWGFGEGEEGGPAAVEARIAEYRELAVLHEKGEFPYDVRDRFAGRLNEE